MRDFESVSKTVEGNEGSKCNYRTRLDTYGCGCAHDCSYCYAKSLLDFRGLWDAKHPSVGDMKKISAEIRKLPREVVRLGGYRHLPLERKREYLSRLTGFEELTVCEDEDRAYAYWKEHVNHNRDDCCNLRRGTNGKAES